MRDLLPNGLLGLAITGLLAAFMAGMAANISAFNTVFSYDLWQDYVVKDREDDYYLRGRPGRDRGGHRRRDRDRHLRGELLQHHGLPADAVRLLQRPAVRDLHPRHVLEADDRHRRLDGAGGRHPLGGRWSPSSARTRSAPRSLGRDPDQRAGRGVRRRLDRLRRRHRAQHRGLAGHQAEAGRAAARAGLLRDARRRCAPIPTRRRRPGTAVPFPWPASRWPWSSPSTWCSEEADNVRHHEVTEEDRWRIRRPLHHRAPARRCTA